MIDPKAIRSNLALLKSLLDLDDLSKSKNVRRQREAYKDRHSPTGEMATESDHDAVEVERMGRYLNSIGLRPHVTTSSETEPDEEGKLVQRTKSMGSHGPNVVDTTPGQGPVWQQLRHEVSHAQQTPVGSSIKQYQEGIGQPGDRQAARQNKMGGYEEAKAHYGEAGISRRAGLKPFKQPGVPNPGTLQHGAREYARQNQRALDTGINRFEPETGKKVQPNTPDTRINLRASGMPHEAMRLLRERMEAHRNPLPFEKSEATDFNASANNQITRALLAAGIPIRVHGEPKTPESLQAKIKAKRRTGRTYYGPSDVHDAYRGRISVLSNDVKDIERAAHVVRSKFEVDDANSPDYAHDPDAKYGRTHLVLMMNGNPYELQIGTADAEEYIEPVHDSIYKNPKCDPKLAAEHEAILGAIKGLNAKGKSFHSDPELERRIKVIHSMAKSEAQSLEWELRERKTKRNYLHAYDDKSGEYYIYLPDDKSKLFRVKYYGKDPASDVAGKFTTLSQAKRFALKDMRKSLLNESGPAKDARLRRESKIGRELTDRANRGVQLEKRSKNVREKTRNITHEQEVARRRAYVERQGFTAREGNQDKFGAGKHGNELIVHHRWGQIGESGGVDHELAHALMTPAGKSIKQHQKDLGPVTTAGRAPGGIDHIEGRKEERAAFMLQPKIARRAGIKSIDTESVGRMRTKEQRGKSVHYPLSPMGAAAHATATAVQNDLDEGIKVHRQGVMVAGTSLDAKINARGRLDSGKRDVFAGKIGARAIKKAEYKPKTLVFSTVSGKGGLHDPNCPVAKAAGQGAKSHLRAIEINDAEAEKSHVDDLSDRGYPVKAHECLKLSKAEEPKKDSEERKPFERESSIKDGGEDQSIMDANVEGAMESMGFGHVTGRLSANAMALRHLAYKLKVHQNRQNKDAFTRKPIGEDEEKPEPAKKAFVKSNPDGTT